MIKYVRTYIYLCFRFAMIQALNLLEVYSNRNRITELTYLMITALQVFVIYFILFLKAESESEIHLIS